MNKKLYSGLSVAIIVVTLFASLLIGCEAIEGPIEEVRQKAEEQNFPNGRSQTYTVTFDSNEATSGTVPSSQTAAAGSSINLPTSGDLAKEGFAFIGWNTKIDGEGTNYDPGETYTVDGNITLFANWSTRYKVTFNINSGLGTIPSFEPVEPGSDITLPDGTGFSRDNFTFAGWNTNPNGKGTDFAADSPYTVITSITLYAKWECTISFNLNGGAGTIPSSRTEVAASEITLPDGTGFSNNTLLFDGWTEGSVTGDHYPANSPYTMNGNTTLFAKWGNTYTVSFSTNSGSGTAPPSQTVVPGTKIALPNTSGTGYSFYRDGYIFGGWTDTGGVNNFQPGDDYTVNNSITLYAKWNPITYTISISISGNVTGDSIKATPDSGILGQAITLDYTVVDTAGTNKLTFSCLSTSILEVTSAESGKRTYNVSFSDVSSSAITINAVFSHTGLKDDSISFASSTVNKDYGEDPFIITVNNSGQGSGSISYNTPDTAVATVIETGADAGKVTILKAGKAVITATKAADATWEKAITSYTLNIAVTTPSAPAAPGVGSKTTSSVTLTAPTGTHKFPFQYAYSTNETAPSSDSTVWQDSPTFNTLKEYTYYYFFARYKAQPEMNNASGASLYLRERTAVSTGAGTPADPYRVYDITTLKRVGKEIAWSVSAHYRMMDNINMTGESFTPIGDFSSGFNSTFKGSFDGNEHYITGLTISGENFLGLFGYVYNNAIIKNLGLVNCNITSNGEESIVGGIAGNCNYDVTIENCYVTGSVQGVFITGGVVGATDSTTVRNCYSTASVIGGTNVGGIVGFNGNSSNVDNCHFTGEVWGIGSVGGVVGANYSDSNMKNCYNTGVVSASKQLAGGVVGENDKSTVQYCYSTSNLICNSSNDIGGVVGGNYGGTVEYCYSTGNVSGVQLVGGVVGVNSDDEAVVFPRYGKVQHCYATGSVSSGSAFRVGGVVGGNFGDCTIQYCYALGDVSGVYLIGGIVGENGGGTVEHCVAMNSKIEKGDGYSAVGRITGFNDGTLADNRARSDMTFDSLGTVGLNTLDGEDVTVNASSGTQFSTVFTGWDSGIWTFTGTTRLANGILLPTLKDIAGNQNPTLPPPKP